VTIKFFSKSETHHEFSNFARFPIEIDGVVWPSTEHYYQAQKFTDPKLQTTIRQAEKPPIAKSLGDKNKAHIRADWESVKDEVMERAVRRKFELHPELRELLLSTGDEELQEAAPTDYYWGVGRDGNGQNKLGLILMRIRAELKRALP
jgi:ribA/ribD-fused uncharacterized protein